MSEPKRVTPGFSYNDYVDENLGIVEYDSDQFKNRSEQDFESRASMEEGVAGLATADASYENTSESIVQKPKSDQGGDSSTVRHPAPSPMDLHRYPHRRT
jgi:hypothetical protein